MLLRIAIGWHFLYEGVYKINSTPEGRDSLLAKILPGRQQPEPPFSAEDTPQRHRAARPLLPRHGPRRRRPGQARPGTNLKAGMEGRDLERIADHYGFDDGAAKRRAAPRKLA